MSDDVQRYKARQSADGPLLYGFDHADAERYPQSRSFLDDHSGEYVRAEDYDALSARYGMLYAENTEARAIFRAIIENIEAAKLVGGECRIEDGVPIVERIRVIAGLLASAE